MHQAASQRSVIGRQSQGLPPSPRRLVYAVHIDQGFCVGNILIRPLQVNLGSLIEVELEAPVGGAAAAGGSTAKFAQIKSDATRKTAKISLNDCLACSGCITSAETILVQQQSLAEFFTALTDATKIHVVTVSPQTRAALAAHFGMNILQVYMVL
jgi:hypothetical protein